MRIEPHIAMLAPELHRLAAEAAPREAAGVITRGARIVAVGNRDPKPEDAFDIGALHELEAQHEGIAGIWHTHPSDSPPSGQDALSCAATSLPWIVAGPSKLWILQPEMRPYEGREYLYGQDDCWEIVSEWYARERAVFLPWFERPADGWWKTAGPSPYLTHAHELGFHTMPIAECGFDDLEFGDIVLMQIAARRVNHAAVYLGGGAILHHLYGELSCIEQLTVRRQRETTHICRHRPC